MSSLAKGQKASAGGGQGTSGGSSSARSGGGTPANATGGSAGSGSKGQQASASAASGDQSDAPPAGVTGGQSPIEATMFAYRALARGADAIAQIIATHFAGTKCPDKCETIAVVNSTDLGGIIAWRSVIAQARLIELRADRLLSLEESSMLCPALVHPAPPRAPAPFIATPGDVQTLAQTLQSFFGIAAINQSVATSTVSVTDAPIIGMVAAPLVQAGFNVIVPGMFPPGVASNPALGPHSVLNHELSALEDRHGKLESASETCQSALDARVQTPGNLANRRTARESVSEARADTMPLHALIAALDAGVSVIESFENSLFVGSAGQSTDGAAEAASPPLQRILLGDLLAVQLWNSREEPTNDDLARVHFLVIHPLEAGGESLTKSNVFIGTRVYYGGGGVITFTLFSPSGFIECAGTAYGYHGDVKSSDVERRLGDGSQPQVAAQCGKPPADSARAKKG